MTTNIFHLKSFFLFLSVCSLLLILKYWTIIPIRDEKNIKFENFNNETGAKVKIVPNIAHYIIFDQNQLNFVGYLSFLSVLKFHKPKNLFVHTNMEQFVGKYWRQILKMARKFGTRIELKFMLRPTHVYGVLLSSVYHATDVSRIHVLRTWGGIYLDTDTVVLKSLDRFRYFEMVVGWPENDFMGTQILICNKDARFLQLWLRSYQYYQPTRWYYNAGQLPTKMILEQHPNLVHRVKEQFGVQNLIEQLYSAKNWTEWKNYYAIHLLSRHEGAPDTLNDTIVSKMQTSFGKIAQKILNT